tara:strand:+ start:936 stop:1970 length:1035 start_codon:yes stop_codon:yes gene_type:complete
MKLSNRLAPFIAAVIGLPAIAEIEVYGNMGYVHYDSERQLNNDEIYSAGLGYRLTPKWRIALEATTASPELEHQSGEIDYDSLNFNVRRDFGEIYSLKPYWIVGIGESKFDKYETDDETYVMAEIGVAKPLDSAFTLSSGIRVNHSLDDDLDDIGINIGLTYTFGSNRQARNVDTVEPEPPTTCGWECLDDDMDGVKNSNDLCPESDKRYQVDNTGCEKTESIVDNYELNISFANNSSEVESFYLKDIERLAKFMQDHSSPTLTIEGHTDDTGSSAYNQALSTKRAEAVKAVLVEEFEFEAEHISTIGYGESKPRDTNDTAKGRAQNRRVVANISASVTKPVYK